KKRLARLRSGEPLAYILGHKEFYGLNFLVNRYTLIPRPETEQLVEEAMSRLTTSEERATIIDVGTGSGCIAITIAKQLKKICHSRAGEDPVATNGKLDSLPLRCAPAGNDNVKIYAIDISKRALTTAKQNAEQNGVADKIEFINGNLLKPFFDSKLIQPAFRQAGIQNSKLHILANLPYLTPEQVKHSPTIQREPKSALISGHDGLKHYRQLFRQIKKLQLSNCTILCEIDDTQGATMSALIKKELPKAKFEIKKDLGGYDRLAVIEY
ncbi:peptide chain release factor N(5)-glutamine methyltransferase, partial [Candidatus Falkowbacteria bacterium]|nr:peptide chain release factor N(5)-glutamine methyltransferase [Candidatus Falkowbacteria bacterium]